MQRAAAKKQRGRGTTTVSLHALLTTYYLLEAIRATIHLVAAPGAHAAHEHTIVASLLDYHGPLSHPCAAAAGVTLLDKAPGGVRVDETLQAAVDVWAAGACYGRSGTIVAPAC